MRNTLNVLMDEEEGEVDQPDTTSRSVRDTPPVPVHTPDHVPDTVTELPTVSSWVRIASRGGRGK